MVRVTERIGDTYLARIYIGKVPVIKIYVNDQAKSSTWNY
jgi:hypothetical protein